MGSKCLEDKVNTVITVFNEDGSPTNDLSSGTTEQIKPQDSRHVTVDVDRIESIESCSLLGIRPFSSK